MFDDMEKHPEDPRNNREMDCESSLYSKFQKAQMKGENPTMNRRGFLQTTSLATAGAVASFPKTAHAQSVDSEQLRRIDEAPTLKPEFLRDPIMIKSVELLRNKRNFLVRIRSKDGAQSVTAPNSLRLKDC